MRTRLLYVCIAMALWLQGAYGEDERNSSIKMRSELSGDEVLLRWVSTDARAWRLLNKYGVRLERYTVVRDGQVLDEQEKRVLAECLRPEESDAFKEIAGKYSYGAIIAQALFGETFEVSGTGQYDVATVIALGQELQQRYVLSLYAADLCFPAAVVAGWGWKDRDVRDNERYLYRVIPLVPEKELKITEGGLFVDMKDKTRLPAAMDLQGHFSDSNVSLSWNFRTLEFLYNAYIPERSTDGIHFTPISALPITRMRSATDKSDDRIMYVDSIRNEVTYYYRVAGITPFGSRGAYSDTISGRGHEELKKPPFITKSIPYGDGGARIEWEFDTSDERLIDGFVLELSEDDKDNYRELITGIGKTDREIQVPDMMSTNYFVIAARTTEGKKSRSLPALVQKVDTIPPAVPAGLSATVDSTGCVRLSWQPVSDTDIYGYRVYRGQTEGEELIPLNDVAAREAAFVDTVDVRSLNGSVYYAVSALDERYNQSDLCPVIEVRKPEFIPPTPPFIREVKVMNGKNQVCWISGQESALAGFEVYRRTGKDTLFEKIAGIEGTEIDCYEDKQVVNNQEYTYQVRSRTVGGLMSNASPEYRVKAINKTDGREVKAELTLTPLRSKVQVAWTASATDIISVQLYKKPEGGTFGLLKEGMEPAGKWVDKAIVPGLKYEYMLVIKTKGTIPVTITKEVAL